MDSNKALANGMRDLAVFVDSIDIPLSRYAAVTYSHYTDDAEVARRLMDASPGGWIKFNSEQSSYVSYEKTWKDESGEIRAYFGVYVNKGTTCQRVQVGTKHVEATEAHDEPIYQWDCSPLPSAPSDTDTDTDTEEI